MMHIKNGTFYHIHQIGPFSDSWQVGAKLVFAKKEKNLFNKFYDTNSRVTDITNENGRLTAYMALHKFLEQPEEYKKQNYESILQFAKMTIEEQGMFIRETIYEEVRANFFPHLPSRKSCVWLCEETSVEYWWNTFKKDKVIFKVNATGIIHKANQKVTKIFDTFCHDFLRACAVNYWSGYDDKSDIDNEVLFEGIIELVDKFENLEEFNKSLNA